MQETLHFLFPGRRGGEHPICMFFSVEANETIASMLTSPGAQPLIKKNFFTLFKKAVHRAGDHNALIIVILPHPSVPEFYDLMLGLHRGLKAILEKSHNIKTLSHLENAEVRKEYFETWDKLTKAYPSGAVPKEKTRDLIHIRPRTAKIIRRTIRDMISQSNKLGLRQLCTIYRSLTHKRKRQIRADKLELALKRLQGKPKYERYYKLFLSVIDRGLMWVPEEFFQN